MESFWLYSLHINYTLIHVIVRMLCHFEHIGITYFFFKNGYNMHLISFNKSIPVNLPSPLENLKKANINHEQLLWRITSACGT
jgi:hypothetical protein